MAALVFQSMKKNCAVVLLLLLALTAACVTPVAAQTTSSTAWPCSVAQCSMCSIGMPNVCVVCQTGYSLMNSGACKPTGSCSVARCDQCFSDDDNFCQTCAKGYRSTVSGGCTRGRNAAFRPLSTATVALVMAAALYVVAMI